MNLLIDASDTGRYADAMRHTMRGQWRGIRIVFTTLVVVGLVWAGAVGSPMPLLLSAAGLPILIMPTLSVHSAMRNLSTLVRAPSRFELTDDYLCQTSALYSSQISWGGFEKLEELPGQLLCYVGKRQFISVPTVGLSGAELAELREFVANRNFLRA